jgi:hypothetical protein
MSRLKDKVDKCIGDDRALSRRIDILESKISKVDSKIDQTKVELETAIDIGETDYDVILENLKKLDSRIDDKWPNPVAQLVVLQDGNKRLLGECISLRADNERLLARLGNMQRCNSNQAKMICKFRDEDRSRLAILESKGTQIERIKALARRVLCNLPCRFFTDTQKELLEEINDESC